eukprot:4000607-Pleurochrysis_carterae.AAC.1
MFRRVLSVINFATTAITTTAMMTTMVVIVMMKMKFVRASVRASLCVLVRVSVPLLGSARACCGIVSSGARGGSLRSRRHQGPHPRVHRSQRPLRLNAGQRLIRFERKNRKRRSCDSA